MLVSGMINGFLSLELLPLDESIFMLDLFYLNGIFVREGVYVYFDYSSLRNEII
jgi:hypothetical protein